MYCERGDIAQLGHDHLPGRDYHERPGAAWLHGPGRHGPELDRDHLRLVCVVACGELRGLAQHASVQHRDDRAHAGCIVHAYGLGFGLALPGDHLSRRGHRADGGPILHGIGLGFDLAIPGNDLRYGHHGAHPDGLVQPVGAVSAQLADDDLSAQHHRTDAGRLLCAFGLDFAAAVPGDDLRNFDNRSHRRCVLLAHRRDCPQLDHDELRHRQQLFR